MPKPPAIYSECKSCGHRVGPFAFSADGSIDKLGRFCPERVNGEMKDEVSSASASPSQSKKEVFEGHAVVCDSCGSLAYQRRLKKRRNYDLLIAINVAIGAALYFTTPADFVVTVLVDVVFFAFCLATYYVYFEIKHPWTFPGECRKCGKRRFMPLAAEIDRIRRCPKCGERSYKYVLGTVSSLFTDHDTGS